MTETRTELAELADGRALRVTYAVPDRAVRGGIVVLHGAHGVTGTVRLLVAALAAEGWLTVAPHLYADDHGAGDIDEVTAQQQVSLLSWDAVLAAADVAFGWLGEREVRQDLLGVVGFEAGGSVALVVAAGRDIGAAVSVSAGGILEPLSDELPALVDVAGELRCPWLGLYGEHDPGVSPDAVDKLRDAAISAEAASDVVWFAENRFDSDQGSAPEAWQRTLNWFDAHLR
jgi:carboxymethylenebutenolidase